MRKLVNAAALILLSIMSISAQGMEINGIIMSHTPLIVQTSDHRQWTVVPSTSVIERDLAQLEVGDYLDISVKDLEVNGAWQVTEIRFVGLRRMLGLWLGSNSTLLQVINFNHFSIYSNSEQPSDLEEFVYALAPDSDGRWSLLLVRDGSVQAGRVWFDSNLLIIELVDAQGVSRKSTYSSFAPIGLTSTP
jgi:hypothetical protein